MTRRTNTGARTMSGISTAVVFALLLTFFWPLFPERTEAAALTNVSATASSSAPGVSTNYVISYTTTNTITAASTTIIRFDPVGAAFDLSTLTFGDVNVSGFTKVGVCGAAPDEMLMTNTADDITFTVCPGDSVSAGAKTITLMGNRVTNPSALGTYVLRINGTMTDSGETKIAILNKVTMTATIDTNLTFTITGVASNTPVNGVTTSTTTVGSATAINFGYLSSGTSTIAAQQLSVSTNAANGYSVTVTQNQNLTSVSGADIDTFNNGNAVSDTAPASWVSPSGSIGIENTYGHFGLTTDDDTLLGGADTYGTALFVGLTSTSTRLVMYNTGPSDGTTQNIGLAKVAYRVQITALQEAATDYTNQLTYVATPVF